MTISIRRADLERDQPCLIRLFREFLTPHSDARRFDWLYRQNPSGTARAWLASSSEDGAVVGAAAAFPRRIYVRGDEFSGYVLGDFCIHPQFRSLGPALQLQRACLQEIVPGSPSLGYDFPSASMLAIYRRLGVASQDRMVRLAKLLRADKKIMENIKVRRAARRLSAVGNRLLEWRDRRRSSGRREEIAQHEGACGEEFSRLASQVQRENEIGVARTADYLNWRFLAHPTQRFEFLTARRNAKLVGYLIFTQAADDARIVDLTAIADTELLSALILEA